MSCHFCDLAVKENRGRPEDIFLAESRSFYVKPGLGHFAEGYTLINSKSHIRSFSYLVGEDLAELAQVIAQVRHRLTAIYQCGVVAFEHGEVNAQHHPGCCLEHAHLHLLPVPAHMDDELNLEFRMERIADLRELTRYSLEGISYLLYMNRKQEIAAYHIDEDLPSQFLRREFCRRFGVPDLWDWAVFPFRDSIEKFLGRYASESTARGWNSDLA